MATEQTASTEKASLKQLLEDYNECEKSVQTLNNILTTYLRYNPTDSPWINENTPGPEHFDESLNGKFCVVSYDGKPYPGIVQDIDDTEIEVNVMHNIRPNQFFWPRMQDVLWYSLDKFVTLIPPPTKVGSRHHQIQPQLWESIKELLDL